MRKQCQQLCKEGGNCGFTLTEIIVTIGIITLMLGMALPNMVAFMPEHRLDRISARIRTQMKAARMEAMSAGVRTMIDFNDSADEFTVWTDLNEDGTTNSNEIATYTAEDSTGTSLRILRAGKGYFQPDGTYDADGTDIDLTYLTVRNSGTIRYDMIIIWPSGQVSTYEYN